MPTFQTLGINFGISESSANNIFRALDRYSQRITASKFIRTSKKKVLGIGMGKGDINRIRINCR
ncbi:transposase family protein [Okeania sp. KiyG1]|uniref:transposase family protein n=1 Tax=Okeania sp. KiyG1 TaxID=2720165 RepID=UPI0027DA5A55|nr:transposase family protein [Okeania sp. KiyG1]